MSAPDPQRRAARIATASAVMVIAAFVAGKAARDAILLSYYSIKLLPLFIGIASVLAFPVIVVAGRLMTRFGPARLVPLLNLASAGCALVEWLLLARYPRVISVAVFIHLSTASAVLVSGFWSIVNERFDVQSAKRHIGRIGMGATLGGIFGGVVAERTAVYLTPDKVLLVLAAFQVVCAMMLYGFAGGRAHEPAEPPAQTTMAALRAASRASLLRNVTGIVVLAAVAGGILDYVFKADIVRNSTPHDGLLRSLAVFYTVTNVITAIIQLALCGPLIARLGVPRSVATLPGVMTAFGLLALIVPGPLAAAVARSAELVTRNSVYRSAYELLYAPLSEERKRPTKVVVDVGADKLGDILGAQIVSMIVFLVVDTRTMLLTALVAVASIALVVALRLRRSYTQALEDSLLDRAAEVEQLQPASTIEAAPHEPWFVLNGLPTSPEAVPLSLRPRPRKPPAGGEDSAQWMRRSAAQAGTAQHTRVAHSAHDPLVSTIADLRSHDPARVRHALALPLPPHAVPHVIDLVGRADVACDAVAALATLAPSATGAIADAMLDVKRPCELRRRLPAVIVLGEPALASWALWRALSDPEFDLRYRASGMLARLATEGHLTDISEEEVFAAVRRELAATPDDWKKRELVVDLVESAHGGDDEIRSPSNLEHVFRVLGLVLPAQPLRIALHAVQTDDPGLRGTALEYLESILPADVRAELWPFLETEPAPAPPPVADTAPPVEVPATDPLPRARLIRTKDELLEELRSVYPEILSRLKLRSSR